MLADEILVFELGGQRFALFSAAVREVLRAFSALPMPKAPPMVEGLLNVRGEVIPLLDIRKRLGIAARKMGTQDHLIVAWDGNRHVALRVDRVLHLLRLPKERVVKSQQFLPHTEVISAAAITEEGMILIQDLGRFLSDAEQALLAEAITEAESAVRSSAGDPRA